MIRLVFLILLAIPFAELFLFIRVQQNLARLYDPASALLLIVASLFASFAFGKWVIRSYGLKHLAEARDTLRSGSLPADGLLDSLLIVAGGVAFMVPGYISDVFGLLLLLPPVRLFLRWAVKAWLVKGLAAGAFRVYTAGTARPQQAYDNGRSTLSDQASDVIDVAAKDV